MVDANFALCTMQNVRSLRICRIGIYLANLYGTSAINILCYKLAAELAASTR